MNTTESRIIPLARRFYRLYLDTKLSEARRVLLDAEGEAERIAVVVEALKQSGWGFAFSTWIQSWHTSDSIPNNGAADRAIRKAQGVYTGDEKRGFRIGRTFRTRDRVRVDGRLFGTVTNNTPDTFPNQIAVRVEGEDTDRVIARHRIAHLDDDAIVGQ
jgi:hypothetical protein